MRRLAVCALEVATFATSAVPALAHDLLYPTSDRVSRFCNDSGILGRVKHRFAYQVSNVPHLPDVAIVAFGNIHERRYEPHGKRNPIARRYCGATAELSDGRHRKVWYLIEDRMGFVGVGDGVEFCVSGFDRWKVYNAHCRVVK